MSEIDVLRELKESLSYDFWDNAAFVALFAVFIGVLGESIVELTNWLKDSVLRAKVGKASALILIAGLGGDIVTYAKNSAINGTIIGFLHKKAGDAYQLASETDERAAKLEVAAAELKKKNLAQEKDILELRKFINVREISNEQIENFVRNIKGKKQKITLILPDDQESRAYGDERLSPLLQKAGFVVNLEDLQGTSKRVDINVCDNGVGEIKLFEALKKANIETRLLSQNMSDRPDFCDVPIGKDGIFRVFVGQRIAPLGR